jgi:ABC-type transport system involved in multi-copper enzyme maturation permease subunit
MAKKSMERVRDNLYIIWTIAAKDIVDALKNRLVISFIIMGSVILLLPKLLPYIFEQTAPALQIYEVGESRWIAHLQDDPALSVIKVHSEQEFRLALCNELDPGIGLRISQDFDHVMSTGGTLELQGYVCWSKRFQASGLRPIFEQQLSQSLGRPVIIQTEENIVFPPSEGVLFMSLTAVNLVVVILLIGIVLVPNLLFEEKQAKTMQALLVSPASISQMVVGKALAGLFYILVTAVVIFAITWVDVIHWGAVVVFVIAGGIFSVAMGLALGSFYEKPQNIAGWMMALLLLLVGATLVKMLGIELPTLVESILPWVPSVALAEICRAAYSETFSATRILTDLGIVLAVSLPLYALVIWKVRRLDR